ncbi:MAG: Mrp/NBP35 family ATP-binding protein [Maricaulaceae bacterium]|nr:Mrp/NBP35 family ATP-binding protein [Maricaulaceae bacterium]
MDPVLRAALDAVTDASGAGLAAAGRVESAMLDGGVATVVLTAPPDRAPDLDALKPKIEKALKKQKSIRKVRVVMTADRPAPAAAPRQPQPKAQAQAPKAARHVIAVAAGKGGVGKSAVAANLAVALARKGLTAGVLDADIYGPSIPRLFGVTDAKGLRKTGAGIEPLQAHGVKIVSMGFLLKPGQAAVWRGPMVQGAIRQFLNETDWGGADVLVIDMPPGTGDAQLAIAQAGGVDGAVIVCTPQDLALDDARKAMAMFEQTHVPLLGLIENMSVFVCPHCGGESEIFGRGGARAEAEALGLPFLGEIPLHIDLRRRSDEGRPVALDDGPLAQAFARAADQMLAAAETARKPAPEIRFE